MERRSEALKLNKTEASMDAKKDKAIAEVLRENLTKSLSKKRDFQAVVEACEDVDLTAPGDIIKKRRQIRQNLRENDSEPNTQSIRSDVRRLTDTMIKYMETRLSTPPASTPTPTPSLIASTPAPSLIASTPAPSSIASTPTPNLNPAIANDLAALNARMARLEALLEKIVNKE